METVVEEKPLSLATSRMVITEVLTIVIERSTRQLAFSEAPIVNCQMLPAADSALELQAVARGHYSTVKSLSRSLPLFSSRCCPPSGAQTAPGCHRPRARSSYFIRAKAL